MAILRVRDEKGNVTEIPAIKGDKGNAGEAGSGTHFGSYGGDGSASQYIVLNSPNVQAVLLDGNDGRTFLVTSNGVINEDGSTLAALIKAVALHPTTVVLALYAQSVGGQYVPYLNKLNEKYNYIAFVSEE